MSASLTDRLQDTAIGQIVSRFWPIPPLCGMLAIGLFEFAGRGSKWLVLYMLIFMAVAFAVYLKNMCAFGIWMLFGAVQLGINYRVLKHGAPVNHFGGALGDPVLALVDIPIIFLIVLWLVRMAINKGERLPRWTVMDTCIIGFLVVSCFSLLNATELPLSFFELLRYVKYIALYWVLRTLIRNDDLSLYGGLAIFMLAIPMHALVALLQYFFGFILPIPVGWNDGSDVYVINLIRVSRVTGLVGHCNTFAGFLLYPWIIGVTFLFIKIKTGIRLLVIPFLGCTVVAMILTFSRAGWLSFALAGLVISAAALWTRRFTPAHGIFAGASAAITAFALVASGVLRVIMIRLIEDNGEAVESRWQLMEDAVYMIRHHPIVGVGLNNFHERLNEFDVAGVINIIDQPVHNIFLLIGAETGILSLILFLALLGVICKYSLDLIRTGEERSFFFGTVCLTACMAQVFDNLFDIGLRSDPNLGMAVILCAVLVSERERIAAMVDRPETQSDLPSDARCRARRLVDPAGGALRF